jgi:hypothetical protein
MSEYMIEDSDDDLRVVKLCYAYSELASRREDGPPLTRADRSRLQSLEQLLCGDPLRRRRRHRRIATLVSATLRRGEDRYQGTVTNVSCGGMFVVTSAPIEEGTTLDVRLGAPGETRYVFPCLVRRAGYDGRSQGLGLVVSGAPVRVSGWQSDETSN